jgi:hypothetical protein
MANSLDMAASARVEQRSPDEAFILGAGFSHAVHQPMPTLLAVGRALREHLLASERDTAIVDNRAYKVLKQGRIPSGNVEMWLSSLAERQPFMTETKTALNQALFQELGQELRRLVEASQQGFWPEAPAWLHRLLRLWHRRTVTVVTFNYDTIVEEAMFNLDAPHDDGDIVSAMLTHLPRPAVTGLGGIVPVRTFRLLKLHGSLDWYWNPEDRSGDSLCRRNPDLTPLDARAALAGKLPFIVPPLATKSPFYSLGVIRELWQTAARALQDADRITVLGYSVPLTDLTTTTMLSEAGHRHTEWRVVDPSGSGVRDRLVELGVLAQRIDIHSSVADWVDTYEGQHCGRMTIELADQLIAFSGDAPHTAPIMTRRDRTGYGVVSAIHKEGEQIILDAHDLDPSAAPVPAEYPHQHDLIEALHQMGRPGPVSVRLDGVEGDHRVLGALDPTAVSAFGAVLLEIQDVPSPLPR